MSKFYVTTAIDYVNASPHIGHALEKVQADTMARFHRLLGDDVYFLTGTDEHGTKLYRAARDKGMEPKQFCDLMSRRFVELTQALNISNDYFVRTTDERHERAAQKLWQACRKDIYLSKYSGYYCVGCEAYLLERDLKDGKCPIHGTEPEVIEEENYFFRLSAYQERLLEWYDSNPDFIVPAERFNEIYSFVRSGLEDISISRSRKMLKWGIDVPGDPEQVMYVWFDALTNYISAVGYEDDPEMFNRYWPADVHVIGKDISRFHCVLWPAMLMSAGLPLPEKVFIHGFLTAEGEKMSKSRGNVVDPFSYIEEFGADPLRYYLIAEIPTTEDGDFSRRRFIERYNYDLANDLGNVLHRSARLINKYLDGRVNKKTDFTALEEELFNFVSIKISQYRELMEKLELREGLTAAMDIIKRLNKYVDEAAPWQVARENLDRFETVAYSVLETLRAATILLQPVIPQTASRIFERIGLEPVFHYQDAAPGLVDVYRVQEGEPLFPRVQS